jgi:hypothetical protein
MSPADIARYMLARYFDKIGWANAERLWKAGWKPSPADILESMGAPADATKFAKMSEDQETPERIQADEDVRRAQMRASFERDQAELGKNDEPVCKLYGRDDMAVTKGGLPDGFMKAFAKLRPQPIERLFGKK